jgi:hypothetical protein
VHTSSKLKAQNQCIEIQASSSNQLLCDMVPQVQAFKFSYVNACCMVGNYNLYSCNSFDEEQEVVHASDNDIHVYL